MDWRHDNYDLIVHLIQLECPLVKNQQQICDTVSWILCCKLTSNDPVHHPSWTYFLLYLHWFFFERHIEKLLYFISFHDLRYEDISNLSFSSLCVLILRAKFSRHVALHQEKERYPYETTMMTKFIKRALTIAVPFTVGPFTTNAIA